MKEKVDIIADILTETQEKFPHIDLLKFKVLYDCWRAQGIKNKIHPPSFYTTAWKRRNLKQKDADSLRKYIGVL